MRRVQMQESMEKDLPSFMIRICDAVEKHMSEHADELTEYEYIYVCKHKNMDKSEDYILGSPYEDGNSSCVFHEGEWYYRNPFDGTDCKVPDGEREVISHLSIMFTG